MGSGVSPLSRGGWPGEGVGAGEGDGAGQGMIPQMQEFYKHTDVFSYGTDPEVNNFYFTLSDFDHTDMAVPYTLYNTKEVLFQ